MSEQKLGRGVEAQDDETALCEHGIPIDRPCPYERSESAASVQAGPEPLSVLDPYGDTVNRLWNLTRNRDGYSRLEIRGVLDSFAAAITATPTPTEPSVEQGLMLFRQLVSEKNALRQLDVFECNDIDHALDCECFWEQCEEWAKADAAARSSQQVRRKRMRSRKEIEADAEETQSALGASLIIEVLLDIRESIQRIEQRLVDVQTNRGRFHVDTH